MHHHVRALALASVLSGGVACGGAGDGAQLVMRGGEDAGSSAVDAPAATTVPPACPVVQTTAVPAGATRSAGYSGTEANYYALYAAACSKAADCVPACVTAGGTMDSCAKGSECLIDEGPSGGFGCLPPTYWLGVGGALSESGMTADAANVILVAIPYDDALVATNFQVSIPDDATITGVRFQVRRATLSSNAIDDTVQILKNGVPVGNNHGSSDAWPATLTYASYGGAYDTWGTSWTVDDIRTGGFGLSVSSKYVGPSAGNERAYIDSVRVTVFYTTPCD